MFKLNSFIKEIQPVVYYQSGFKKRTILTEDAKKNIVAFSLENEQIDMFQNFTPGENVIINFRIKTTNYKGKYYTNLSPIKVTSVTIDKKVNESENIDFKIMGLKPNPEFLAETNTDVHSLSENQKNDIETIKKNSNSIFQDQFSEENQPIKKPEIKNPFFPSTDSIESIENFEEEDDLPF